MNIYTAVSYTHLVQAAIGSSPLAMGLPCGELILTIAVLSILITAPLGAFMIDLTYPKLLQPVSYTHLVVIATPKAPITIQNKPSILP